MKREILRRFKRNKLGLFGLIFILFVLLLAIFARFVISDKSENANTIVMEIALQKPFFKCKVLEVNEAGKYELIPLLKESLPDSFARYRSDGVVLWEYFAIPGDSYKVLDKFYLLGTDRYGRDVWSRLIIGAAVSLKVGFMSVLISLVLGGILGLFSGYYGGAVDRIIMWFVNVVWSLPTLLIAIAISFLMQEKNLSQVYLAIGFSMWVELARIIRGQVLQLREQEYITAARVFGFGDLRIMCNHILPNLTSSIIVICSANFASAILLEAGLSFLGLGVQPPVSSWGGMIKEHYHYIAFEAVHLALVPGIAIMLLVMSFNFVGNALRDALDTHL